ncbi:hypothetical protein QQ045_017649 [Rhodiola kirilowii]
MLANVKAGCGEVKYTMGAPLSDQQLPARFQCAFFSFELRFDMEPKEMTFEDLYVALRARPHKPSRFVEAKFRSNNRFEDRVCDILQRSGWQGLLTLSCDKDVEDICEFLASFNYVERKDHEGIW